MEILGIGPLELLLILAIALIVLGPDDMAKAGRTVGKFLRRIVTSPEWRTIQRASKDIRYLPNRLMREAGLEEEINKMKELSSQDDIKGLRSELEEWRRDVSAWTTPPPTIETPRERLNPREPKTERSASADGAAEDPQSTAGSQDNPTADPEHSETE